MLHIKLKRERSTDHYASKNFDITNTPDLWVKLKGLMVSIILIELSINKFSFLKGELAYMITF